MLILISTISRFTLSYVNVELGSYFKGEDNYEYSNSLSKLIC